MRLRTFTAICLLALAANHAIADTKTSIFRQVWQGAAAVGRGASKLDEATQRLLQEENFKPLINTADALGDQHFARASDALSRVFGADAKFRLVPMGTEPFLSEFRQGVEAPRKYLEDVAKWDQAYIRDWLNTPQEQRIFAIGSKEDYPNVERLVTTLRDRGFSVFFYKMCTRPDGKLCPSQAVGAFCATAGSIILSTSSHASGSRHVSIEQYLALQAQGQLKEVILLKRQELVGAAAKVVAPSSLLVYVYSRHQGR